MNIPVKRFRLFAGPNGSGKTTLVKEIKRNFNIGTVVNPDQIESHISKHYKIYFRFFHLNIHYKDWEKFTQKENHFIKNFNLQQLVSDSKLSRNTLRIPVYYETNKFPYFPSFISSFITSQLLEKGIKFSLESVMSHPSKIYLLKNAVDLGFRTYLYYIATSNVEINLNRIKFRVSKGGHFVEPEKVIQRYKKSIKLLPDAIKLSNRSFIFDNSSVNKLYLEFEYEKLIDDRTTANDNPRWINKLKNEIIQ